MRGHLRRRGKSGLWSIVLRDPDTGKVQWTSTGTADRHAAEAMLARAIVRLEQERGTDAGTLTVRQWLQRWLAAKAIEVRPRSMEMYRRGAAIADKHLGGTRLRALRPADVTRFLAQASAAGLTPWQVRQGFRALRAALRYAVQQEVLPRDVTDACRAPKVPSTQPRFLTPDEARAVLSAAREQRYHALWHLALTTGMRRGELLGLQWEDIDLAARTVTISRTLQRLRGVTPDGRTSALVLGETKTGGSRRVVVLLESVAADLCRWRDEQDQERAEVGPAYSTQFVFTTAFGRPVDPYNLAKQFARLLSRAGVQRVRLHDLRHTYAALMIATGAEAKVLQRAMGHASSRTTLDVYGHLYDRAQREAADALGALLEAPQERPASKAVSTGAPQKGRMAK